MDGLVDYSTYMVDSTRWLRFEHRPDDVVISTPPKCGTTWTQMLCALLIFESGTLPEPLDNLSPWLDVLFRSEADVFARLASQTHRRFIKTHTPLDGLPIVDGVTYVVVGRDPRDAMVSMEHHGANLDSGVLRELVERQHSPNEPFPTFTPDPDPSSRFRTFIESDVIRTEAPSLRSVANHMLTGWKRRTAPNVVLLHYRDLQLDVTGEMARLARALGIDMPRERIASLAESASLSSMRERAAEVAPESQDGLFRDLTKFFRSGGSGEWSDRGSRADHDRYAERVNELVANEDLVQWMHSGRIETGVHPQPGR